MAHLEHIFQSHLHLAHVGARRADLAEAWRSEGRFRITPVWMVREVEGLEPELDRMSLRETEILMRGEIPPDNAGRHDRVPSGGAESPEGLKHEGAGVEPAIDSPLVARQIDRFSGRVLTIVAYSRIRLISASNDGLRESALERENRADLPSSQHRVDKAALVHEPPSFTEGQLVEHRRYRPVRYMETGQAALRAEIVAVLGK